MTAKKTRKKTTKTTKKTAKKTAKKPAPPAVQQTVEPTERPMAACRKCGGTDLVVVRTVANRPLRGCLPDGRKYTRVIHQRIRCRTCGTNGMLVAYPFNPKEWEKENR